VSATWAPGRENYGRESKPEVKAEKMAKSKVEIKSLGDLDQTSRNMWAHVSNDRVRKLGLEPEQGKVYFLLYHKLAVELATKESQIPLPYQENIVRFGLKDSGTMPLSLQKKYPEIRSYIGKSLDAKITASATVDINPAGLHAQIHGLHGDFYLDPVRGAKTVLQEGLILHFAYSKKSVGSGKGIRDNPLRQEQVL